MSEIKSKGASYPMVTALCRTVFRSKRFNILDVLATLIVAHLKCNRAALKTNRFTTLCSSPVSSISLPCWCHTLCQWAPWPSQRGSYPLGSWLPHCMWFHFWLCRRISWMSPGIPNRQSRRASRRTDPCRSSENPNKWSVSQPALPTEWQWSAANCSNIQLAFSDEWLQTEG